MGITSGVFLQTSRMNARDLGMESSRLLVMGDLPSQVVSSSSSSCWLARDAPLIIEACCESMPTSCNGLQRSWKQEVVKLMVSLDLVRALNMASSTHIGCGEFAMPSGTSHNFWHSCPSRLRADMQAWKGKPGRSSGRMQPIPALAMSNKCMKRSGSLSVFRP